MKIPPRLIPLVEDGIIDEVIGQVRSGKEADVFIVRVGEEIRCAKVYKEAKNRSFRQAVQYQEGRTVQNSRSARAMSKRTRYGQKEAESSWINAEVEALNKLAAAGLRVPKPYGFFDGVLIMELIMDAEGQPAPRLDDITLTADVALLYHEEMIAQIVKMLCVGLIHGDLSEFNVLVDAEGPVIIDLPQAVNAAGNNSAAMMFKRDVDNMTRYFGRFEPGILTLNYGQEIWALYEKGKLTPHVELTGRFEPPHRNVDVTGVLNAIGDARQEHEEALLKKNPSAQGPRPPISSGPRFTEDPQRTYPNQRPNPNSRPSVNSPKPQSQQYPIRPPQQQQKPKPYQPQQPKPYQPQQPKPYQPQQPKPYQPRQSQESQQPPIKPPQQSPMNSPNKPFKPPENETPPENKWGRGPRRPRSGS